MNCNQQKDNWTSWHVIWALEGHGSSKDGEVNLNAEDAEDDEERAADKDDVSNWTQWRQQSLNNKFQARSSTDDSAAAAAAHVIIIILQYQTAL